MLLVVGLEVRLPTTWSGRGLFIGGATPGGRLSAANLQVLGRASLAACDGLDGIEDGIISHVAACHFDPATLRCAVPQGVDTGFAHRQTTRMGGRLGSEVPTALPAVPSPAERAARTGATSDDDCLTDAQIATVHLVHSQFDLGVILDHGIDSYPGWPVGHEDNPGGWQPWITGLRDDLATSLGAAISGQTLRFMIAHEPGLDPLQFSPVPYADDLSTFSVLVDATDPDLSAFAARGGKLILWHGWADYGVSAYSTARYYEQVVATMARDTVDGFVRFYTSPGVDHLGGGPGAGTTDFLTALTAWVESAIAPGDMVSSKRAQGADDPVFARPLCRYPMYARYDGIGDTTAAESFTCAQ